MLYRPIFKNLFKKYSYTWDDIDEKIYKKILKEEGYTKKEINMEINFIKENGVDEEAFSLG